ncbi:acyltransferase family protein [Cohnella sp. CBP 2801]|uniref:Acyltransferase family protein n=2 Tax=Cohnella zeiphila TaxID=2761120 RepID=A0A7X0VUX7_9BACL|nr:acyltransferase family protein [Cohnella zeiphila]
MSSASARQTDLDWIRILMTLVVVLYHCSMFFNPQPWHVKNNELDNGFIFAYTNLAVNGMMPIFFAVSGISAYYSLQKRDSKGFLKERLLRLGVPLAFGVFVLSPPQVYMERSSHHQFAGSLLDFLPHYFDGLYLNIGGQGNFAFAGLHLWYLFFLLLFSLLTAPLFVRTKRARAEKPFGIRHFALMLVSLFVLAALVNDAGNLGGWGILYYLTIYICGFYFFSKEPFQAFVRRSGLATGIGAASSTLIFILWMRHGIPASGTALSALFVLDRVVSCWCGMLFVFFLADRYLKQTRGPALSYGMEASMPIYVMHQPVIVTIGYLIYALRWPVPAKLLFLLAAVSLVISVLYHFVIRRNNVLRVLFGMKAVRRRLKKNSESRS